MRKAGKWGLLAIVLLLVAIVGFRVIVAVREKGVDHLVTLIPAPEKPCPDPSKVQAFLVLGQSQGANTGFARTIAKSDHAYSYLNGKCWHLQDPVKGPPEPGGSIWPSFADSYGLPVLIADMAITGSSITQWTDPEQVAKVQAVLAGMRRAGYEPIILWLNGETDAAANMSTDEYDAQLNRLAAALPGARWLLSRESRCYDRQFRYWPLEEARRRFVAADPARRKIGADLDLLGVDMRQGDKCHLNRQGQRMFGDALARSVRAAWSD